MEPVSPNEGTSLRVKKEVSPDETFSDEEELEFVCRCGGSYFKNNERVQQLMEKDVYGLNGRFGARLSFGGQDGLTVELELVGGVVWRFSLRAILVMEVD